MKKYMIVITLVLAGCGSSWEPQTREGYQCVSNCRAEHRDCINLARDDSAAGKFGNSLGCGFATGRCYNECERLENEGILQ